MLKALQNAPGRGSVWLIIYMVFITLGVTAVYHLANREAVTLSRAEKLYKTGRYQQAARLLNSWRESGDPLIYKWLGQCYLELGQYGKAMHYQERYVIAGSPEPGDIRHLIGLYKRNHQWDRALQIYMQQLQAYPENRALQIEYARTLADAGRIEAAISIYKTILGESL
ncbi:MAG: tetratricopeptide repeat protein [Thermodesulfobacteriota bacterium]|nr:tetratricopeptide repeat protein [Thermodesulfobacteriota bacterium]